VAHAYVHITVGSSTPAQHHRPLERTRKVSFHHLKSTIHHPPSQLLSSLLFTHRRFRYLNFSYRCFTPFSLHTFTFLSSSTFFFPAAKCMPSPPPTTRRYPRPTRNERIARRAAREGSSRDSPRSADNSAFLQLASLQFEALARQTTTRRISRSRSPLRDNHRRSRSRSPPRRPATNRRLPENHREPPTPQSVRNPPSEQYHNPFTVTQDRDPHQEAGSTARPSPEAEESVLRGQ
jgi:hypothetical protein